MKHMKNQIGASIILVIFLLAVVSALVVSILTMSSTQQMANVYTYRGTQAYFASRAGLDYALARVVSGNTCAGISTNLTIQGYTVTVTCAVAGTYDEGDATSYSIYNLSAVASIGSFQVPDVANRQVRASIKFP